MKKKEKNLRDEMEEDYQKMFKVMDKVFEKEFGKMCPEFEPACIQCEAHLIYNKFKKEIWDRFVK